MNTHTPGPWRNNHLCIETDTGWIAEVRAKGKAEANARLIAAAPDLLTGCEAALAYLADPPSVFPENRAAAVEIIRAALNKAKGIAS